MKRTMLILLLLAAACSPDASHSATPHPGTLTVDLTSAGINDGAIVMLVSGGPVTSVSAPAGYDVASNIDSAGAHVMVIGNVAPGPLVLLTVPDVSRATAYVVTVEQVSDRTTFGLLDPAPYQVTITAQ